MRSLQALAALLRTSTALEVYQALQQLSPAEGGHKLAEALRLAPPAVWDGQTARPMQVQELAVLARGKSAELLQELLQEAEAQGCEACAQIGRLLRRARWARRQRGAVAHA